MSVRPIPRKYVYPDAADHYRRVLSLRNCAQRRLQPRIALNKRRWRLRPYHQVGIRRMRRRHNLSHRRARLRNPRNIRCVLGRRLGRKRCKLRHVAVPRRTVPIVVPAHIQIRLNQYRRIRRLNIVPKRVRQQCERNHQRRIQKAATSTVRWALGATSTRAARSRPQSET